MKSVFIILSIFLFGVVSVDSGGGLISEASTSTPLGGGAAFTSDWVDIRSHPSVVTSVLTDQNGTLYMEFSGDAVNVDTSFVFAVAANVDESHRKTAPRRYFRARYVNGAIAQTSMRLQSLSGQYTATSFPANTTSGQDVDTTFTRSIPPEYVLSQGLVEGHQVSHRYGRNTDIDTGTPEDLVDSGGLGLGFPTGAETLEIFSSSVNDDLGGTGAERLYIEGLDADYNLLTETVTLDGTTGVITTGVFLRVNRAYVTQSNNGANTSFNDGTITIRQSTTTSAIFSIIQIGFSQTELARYSVPAGKTAYVRNIDVYAKKGTAVEVEGAIYYKPFGAAPRLLNTYYLTDTEPHPSEYYGGLEFPEKSDIVLRITASTSLNVEVVGEFDIIEVDNT